MAKPLMAIVFLLAVFGLRFCQKGGQLHHCIASERIRHIRFASQLIRYFVQKYAYSQSQRMGEWRELMTTSGDSSLRLRLPPVLGLTKIVHNSAATVAFQSIVSHGCQRDQLHRCVKTAEPLLRNPDYVVPSTISDVSTHCRIGNEFIDCIRSYALICLTSDRRQQQLQIALDEAVKNDEMCSNPIYQADYLMHAPCIKSMATEDEKCRKQLNYLIDQVSALSISNIQICCAHHAFRECMLSAADRNCQASLDGRAVQFTKDMFSKSLAFLLKQCEDYVPNSAQCPSAGATAKEIWETSVPQQDTTRPPFNDFTTRRSNNFIWQQTTFKPWYPGIRSNSLDTPKQQGLFSNACKSTGNVLLFLPILSIAVLF